MTRLAWRELRRHLRRLAAVLIAIVLSVGFLVASIVFVSTEVAAVGRGLVARTAGADVVAEVDADRVAAYADRVRAVPGVDRVDATVRSYSSLTSPTGSGLVTLSTRPTVPGFASAVLRSGRWPWTAGEIVLASGTARGFGVTVGQGVTLAPLSSRDAPRPLRVVGLTDEPRSLLAGSDDQAVVDPAFFARADGKAGATASAATLLIAARPGVDPERLQVAVRGVLPTEFEVSTTAQQRSDALAALAHGADLLRVLLLTFGGVALLVGTMLIANTYTVILASRRRNLALLRAVGAGAGQLRWSVAVESALVGLVGSALGVGCGCAAAAVGAAVTGTLSAGLAVPPLPVALAGLGGAVVTVLAALVPAARASRVSPLEALRPVAPPAAERRTRRVRLVLVSVAIALGAGAIGWSLQASDHVLLVAVGGSLLLAFGLLGAAPLYLPAALRVWARVGRGLGSTTRLAGANLVRNPKRAAATCVALMLAVGLVVTMQVGAATMRATVLAGIARELPVDLTLTRYDRPLDPSLAGTVAAVPGVRASVGVRVGQAELVGLRDDLTVAGLGPDAAGVVADGLDRLTPDTVLVRPALLEALGVHDGQQVRLRSGRQTLRFTARASKVPTSGLVVVTDARLRELVPRARVGAVWAAAADRSDPARLLADLRQATADVPQVDVGGSLPDSVSYTRVLDTLLTVATALLGVAVLIALVGVGNTLSLSVLERARESALLRALGLQRRQLARTLAVEGVALAVLGSLVGIGAGVVFGVVGAAAAARETQLGSLQIAVSVPQTAAVVAGAVLAGVLASVLPGRQAAAASPVSALAAT